MAVAATAGGWALRAATSADIDGIMEWFPSRDSVEAWGGPGFRYPYTRRSFRKDVQWGRIRSYGLVGPAEELVAFGQLYRRSGRAHLARLVVRPGLRGRGIGRRLIERLMDEGRRVYGATEFSLFVLRDNEPALACYRRLGFAITDYPDDMPHGDVCWFLTRPGQPVD